MSDEESHTVTSIDDDYKPELGSSSTTSANANSDSNTVDANGDDDDLKSEPVSQTQPPAPPSSTTPTPTPTPTSTSISTSTSASASSSTSTEGPSSNPLQSILSTSNSSKPATDSATSKHSPPPTRVKNVKFADHAVEIIDSNNNMFNDSNDENSENEVCKDQDDNANADTDAPSKSATKDDAEKDKDHSAIEVFDDNEDNNYDPKATNLPPKPSTSNIDRSIPIDESRYSNINVPLFNEIVQFFITSPLFNAPQFDALSPAEKETTLLEAYKASTGRNVNPDEVNINFKATTSYNKINMKPSDDRQLLVPINPYCRRPDLTLGMDTDEKYQFDEFKRDAENHSKEFECLNFPPGSRLFVGNLAVNSLKISDVWRVFKRYGAVKAVNMKQGYGFVQFIDANSCHKAIHGEEHVPLHNRLMHLQVSKTHEKHTENRSKDSSVRERERVRGRERERSPKRTSNERQRSPHRASRAANQNKKVRVIISLESEASFNHLLVNSLNEVGLECSIKHVDSTAEEVPQETISESAYAGVAAAIVTSRMELVNLFLFQRDSNDGAIKFDEYENISMESAINFIANQCKKDKVFDNNNNNNARNNQNNYRSEQNMNSNDRRRNQGRDNNNNGNNSRGDRNRNDRRKNNHNRDNRDNRDRYVARNQNYPSNMYSNGNENSNSNTGNNIDSNGNPSYPRYSPRQQDEQKHLPPQVPGMGTNYTPNQMYQQVPTPNPQQYYGYNSQPPPLQQQPPPPQQQQSYYPNNNQNAVASQLMSQLSSLDEGSLKAMLNLVNQQQHQQQQRAALSPHMPIGNGMYPSQAASMPMQPQIPTGPAATASVGGLLAQLQNMVPGTNVNNMAPVAANNPNSYPANRHLPNSNQQQPSGNRESQQQNGGEDASRLFETLARLKNNM
ncbi:hypothetical protein PMKS-002361 [Pichia membranifaciens]|uniref:RRM domain-containing protein n=1 Tax=Pichia membranifaciens TaxID=4926 RepID=A0A1Q2YHL9_9ASCO|nr:hypothetical protein PMKS-002361 [Pichia membranifaciens]